MSNVMFWQAALTVLAAAFVLIRSVCMINAMTAQTPKFIVAFYLADGIGAFLTMSMPVVQSRMPTIVETVFVVGMAVAFIFDRRSVCRATAGQS